jgi:hypothetical protein
VANNSQTSLSEKNAILRKSHIPCQPSKTFPNNSSCITIVTSYFILKKAKHSHKEYEIWLRNFLGVVEKPIVIFTQSKYQDFMVKIRNGKPTRFILYDDIWDIPWQHENNRSVYIDYNRIHNFDPEQSYHSPELYAVWNSKAWMLKTVSELNPFNSTFFYWMDIGCVRNPSLNLEHFPSVEKAIQVFGTDVTYVNI